MKQIQTYECARHCHRRIKSSALRDEVFQIIENAAINANDTYTDSHELTWDEVFIYTLQSQMTYRETSSAARNWFARRGITG